MTLSLSRSSRFCLQSFLLLAVAVYSQSTLAQSTTTACSVCGEGLVIGSPDNVLKDPFGDQQVSCADIDAIGQSGGYSTLECAAIQFSVYANCDCQAESNNDDDDNDDDDDDDDTATKEPTQSPVVDQTELPTEQPETDSPTVSVMTNAPTVEQTEEPTEPQATQSPTVSPTVTGTTLEPTVIQTTSTPTPAESSLLLVNDLPSVDGMVVIHLQNVAGIMPATTIAAYEEQITQFFADYLATDASPPVLQVEAVLLRQLLDEPNRNRYMLRRRHLQSTNMDSLQPLETILQVTGRRNTLDGKNGTIDSLLIQTVNENSEELVENYLRNAIPAINQIYFKPIESVVASEVVVPAETDDDVPKGAPIVSEEESGTSDGGLKTGAIIGILVGGLCIIAAFMSAAWYSQVGKAKLMEDDTAGNRNVKRRTSERSLDSANSNAQSDSDNDVDRHPPEKEVTEAPLAARKVAPAPAGPVVAAAARPQQLARREEPVPARVPAQIEEESDEGEEDIRSEASDDEHVEAAPTTTGKVTRQITAPAGKLGIVIDTTLEGPVIHKVNMLSPLEGMLKTGDIIVAINDVDTKAMGSSAITAHMIKTANQKRTLTVLTSE